MRTHRRKQAPGDHRRPSDAGWAGARLVVVLLVMVVPLATAIVLPVGRADGSTSAPGAQPTDAAVAGSHSDSSALPSRVLYSWGSNDWGQLGRGTSGAGVPTPVAVPAPVGEPEGDQFRTVAAGGAFSVGLTAGGVVYSWGAAFAGQLGAGSLTGGSIPRVVTVPDGPVVAVAAGSSHALALTSSGKVYAWGAGQLGQLGNGTTTMSDTPVPVSLPSGVTVTAVAAGGDHSLALTSTGRVYAWGANFDGQVGNGTEATATAPVPAVAPSGVTFTAIAAGTAHSLALASTGTVYAWGANAAGQLGNGTRSDSATMTPVSMPGGARITSIATGSAHSLALTSTGKVYAWGSNIFGQLDSALVGSLPVDSTVPVQPLGLPPLTAFVAIAGGLDSSYAITSAGVPWVWGGNAYGQLGVGSPGLDEVLPMTLATLPAGTLATGLFSGPDASAAFLVTRSDQTISFPALPSRSYGGPSFDATAHSDSGLAVATHSSGACSGPSAHLQLSAVGLCTLTAAQAGSFWFYPAGATATFEVTQAQLTVVPANARAPRRPPADRVLLPAGRAQGGGPTLGGEGPGLVHDPGHRQVPRRAVPDHLHDGDTVGRRLHLRRWAPGEADPRGPATPAAPAAATPAATPATPAATPADGCALRLRPGGIRRLGLGVGARAGGEPTRSPLLRFHVRHAAQRAGGRCRLHPDPRRLLAGGCRRWDLQLRRGRVPRLDGRHSAQPAHRRHRPDARRRRLLGGGGRRGHLRLR